MGKMSTVKSRIINYEPTDWIPQMPVRSELFNLEPVGIGAAFVESLSSYIYRLAEAHYLSPSVLIEKIVSPAINSRSESKVVRGPVRLESTFVTAAMGMGKTAQTIVTALEFLTSVEKLHFLTMLTWRNIFAYQALIKPFRTWCPDCLDVWRVNRATIYEPLLWTVGVVNVCPIHLRELESQCNSCNSQFLHFMYGPTVGHCSKCGCWLGHSRRRGILSGETADELWVAKEVGVLLAAAPHSEDSLDDNVVVNLLLCCASKLKMGLELSAQLGFQPKTLSKWKSKYRRPQLLHFLQLVKRLNLSVQDVLSGNYAGLEVQFDDINRQRSSKSHKQANRKSDWSNDAKILSKALAEHPAPSLLEVAKRLYAETDVDRYIARLRLHLPDLCKAISSRHTEYKKLATATCLNTLIESDEYPPPSIHQVQKRISKMEGRDVSSYLYKYFPKHLEIISARYRAYKAQQIVERNDTIREKVRHAVFTLKLQGKYPSCKKVMVFLNLNSFDMKFKRALAEIRKEFDMESQGNNRHGSKDQI